MQTQVSRDKSTRVYSNETQVFENHFVTIVSARDSYKLNLIFVIIHDAKGIGLCFKTELLFVGYGGVFTLRCAEKTSLTYSLLSNS